MIYLGIVPYLMMGFFLMELISDDHYRWYSLVFMWPLLIPAALLLGAFYIISTPGIWLAKKVKSL